MLFYNQVYRAILQRHSAKQLEFWSNVKKHYQNVEMHSIEQAEAINTTGVYRVGNIRKGIRDFKVQ